MKHNESYYHSPIGWLQIVDDGEAIIELHFRETGKTNSVLSVLQAEVFQQLDAYFDGRLQKFNLPLSPKGSPFQKSVWNALCDIPYGKTNSYGQIAKKLRNPKACRAVGMASHNNPIAIIVPCHRVIGVNGSLVGYAGGLEKKKFLLELESKVDATRLY